MLQDSRRKCVSHLPTHKASQKAYVSYRLGLDKLRTVIARSHHNPSASWFRSNASRTNTVSSNLTKEVLVTSCENRQVEAPLQSRPIQPSFNLRATFESDIRIVSFTYPTAIDSQSTLLYGVVGLHLKNLCVHCTLGAKSVAFRTAPAVNLSERDSCPCNRHPHGSKKTEDSLQ